LIEQATSALDCRHEKDTTRVLLNCHQLVYRKSTCPRADPAPFDRPMIPPAEAISRLKEGNGRFIAGNPQHPHESSDERAYIAKTAIKMLAQFLWA
jgi:hypothetical protein